MSDLVRDPYCFFTRRLIYHLMDLTWLFKTTLLQSTHGTIGLNQDADCKPICRNCKIKDPDTCNTEKFSHKLTSRQTIDIQQQVEKFLRDAKINAQFH